MRATTSYNRCKTAAHSFKKAEVKLGSTNSSIRFIGSAATKLIVLSGFANGSFTPNVKRHITG